MNKQKPKVCIIGAGSTGITAAKALKEKGIAFDCYEKGSDIGGNWRYNNDNSLSSAYRTLHIISSKWNMQYSDFPMPDEFPDYGHHTDVLRYFENYVDHFDIRKSITFNTEVRDVSPTESNTWNVTLSSGKTICYSAVLIANGHHWNPRLPDFPGQFNGEQIHSHFYKSPEKYENKNVLVVGIGNSGCDIAIDLCRLAKNVYLSTRRSAHVIPKYLIGKPTDTWATPSLDAYTPLWFKRLFIKTLTYLTVGNQENYGLPKPKHKLLSEHPTVNQEFLAYVGHGRVKIKPNIGELQGDSVSFADGSREPFDAIIYATGYQIAFPFLKPEIFEVKGNQASLYRRVIHPDLPNLYFLGLIQPLGAIMPLAEIQGKWIAGVINNDYALPDKQTMLKWIQRDKTILQKRYVDSPRHTIQVDFWDYFHQIKREMRQGARRAVKAS